MKYTSRRSDIDGPGKEKTGVKIMSKQLKWENDFEKALSRAKSEKKFVLLDFYNPH